MAGYTRQDTTNNISTGNIINAGDFDNEYNAIEAAFNKTTGHAHDGTDAEGAPITKVGPGYDVVVSTTAVTPKTNNTVDIGSALLKFKDAHFSGTVDADTLTTDNATIGNATFNNGYTEETSTANSGTAYTISFTGGTVQFITMTGNCTFTFPTPTAGKSFTLFLKQDGTGSRTATWPASVLWPYGITPVLTLTANKTDRFVFTADGTNWFGTVAGQSY